MRTLVIGIPLPNATFDNYSFASAPSLSEYARLVVEMSSVARLVDEVINASAEHRTFGGQLVVNRPAAANEFTLGDLLAIRRREADRFFARGGTAALISHPEAHLDCIEGAGAWRSYDWLPPPEGLNYSCHLLPGFGKEAATSDAAGHPFQTYIDEFAPSFRYRVTVEDASIEAAGGTILARSAGGISVALDLTVGNGRILIIPPLADPGNDRQRVADALLAGFDGLTAQQPADVPEWIRKEVS
jgi:hypothetical protein